MPTAPLNVSFLIKTPLWGSAAIAWRIWSASHPRRSTLLIPMPSTPSSTATLHAYLIVSIKHVNSATQHLPEPFRRLINVCCHIGFQQTTERHHVVLNAIRWPILGPFRFHKDWNLYRGLQLLIVTGYSPGNL